MIYDAVIIGGGIAGVCLCHQLIDKLNWKVKLIEQNHQLLSQSSSVPFALLFPLIASPNQPTNHIHWQAFKKSVDFYHSLQQQSPKGLIVHQGIQFIARDLRKVRALKDWQRLHLATARLFRTTLIQGVQSPTFFAPQALVLNTQKLREVMTEKIGKHTLLNTTFHNFQNQNSGFRVRLSSKPSIKKDLFLNTSRLFLTLGIHSLNFPFLNRHTSFTQNYGQMTQVKKSAFNPFVAQPTLYKTLTFPYQKSVYLGSTFKRDQVWQPLKTNSIQTPPLSQVQHEQNIQLALEAGFKKSTHITKWSEVIQGGFSGWRLNTPHRLPFCQEVESGLYTLTALGSRGFQWAPFLTTTLVKSFQLNSSHTNNLFNGMTLSKQFL